VSSALPEAGRKRIVEAAVERRVVQRSGFFFQAEDGIRGFHVTGVQTCALPISGLAALDALNSLRPPYGDEAGPWLQQINALLKRLCLQRYPQRQCQTLTGRAWLALLDSRCPSAGLTRWMVLVEGAYRPRCRLDDKSLDALRQAIDLWIRKHV